MLNRNVFGIPDSVYLVDNITTPISKDTEIFLHSISIPTQPNDLPTIEFTYRSDSILTRL